MAASAQRKPNWVRQQSSLGMTWGTKFCQLFPQSVQFSHSVMSNSLRAHGLQHTRLPCPSPTPRACSNSCPSSRWCHPTISSSVIPFSSCLRSFPASGSFPMSQFFTSGGQSFGASQLQHQSCQWIFRTDFLYDVLTGLISLLSKGLSRVFSNITVQKHQLFSVHLFLWSNSHIHTWLLEKPQLLLDGLLSAKWCLCCSICYLGFSILSTFSQQRGFKPTQRCQVVWKRKSTGGRKKR